MSSKKCSKSKANNNSLRARKKVVPVRFDTQCQASSKECSKCGKVLPLEAFHKDKRREGGLRPDCKECKNAANRQHRKDNPDKGRQYRKDNAGKIKEWREDNAEHCREYNKQWKKENHEKVRAHHHNRRAREAAAPGHFSDEQWLARLAYYGHKCIYCGSSEDIQIEHRIPLSRDGSNWPANLAPACRSCNCSKGTKTELEFKAQLAMQAGSNETVPEHLGA